MGRCVYTVRGKDCGRPGTGNPCLCAKHLALLADEVEDEYEDEGEGGVVDQVLSHPAAQGILAQITKLIDRAGDALERGINNVGQPQGAPGQPPRPRPRQDPLLQARMVLGFGPTVELTVKMVKERRRKLAAIIHSDRATGSEEAMKRLNTATDTLLASLKKSATP